jgi:non-specific serine/threonine protein kinase
LGEPEQRLYARLSIFRGGWSLDAAERVCGDDIGLDVYDGLTSLTEQNLVRSLTGAGPEPRFGMLNVVREDAATRLASSPSAGSVARAHAEWVLGFVEAAAPELERRDLRAWQRRVRIEEDNIRAALRWTIDRGEAEIGQRIAAACWRFWHYWGRSREGIEWLAAVLDLDGRLSDAATRARAHVAMGHLLRWQHRPREALAHFERALPIILATGDADATADVMVRAFTAAADIGDLERMRELIVEKGKLVGLGALSFWDVGRTLALYEYIYAGVGSYEECVAPHEEWVDHLQSIGRVLDSVERLASLAWIRAGAGRHQGSLDASRQALRTFYELGHLGHLGLQLEFCARAELALGHTERAVRLAVAAQRRADELGNMLATYPTGVQDPVEEGRARLSAAAYARAVAEGEAMTIDEAVAFALSRRVSAARGRTRPADPGVLTDREAEVLALLIDGRGDVEIGEALFISPKTASAHVFAIKGKLGAGSRAEIVTIAFRRGLATADAQPGKIPRAGIRTDADRR